MLTIWDSKYKYTTIPTIKPKIPLKYMYKSKTWIVKKEWLKHRLFNSNFFKETVKWKSKYYYKIYKEYEDPSVSFIVPVKPQKLC